MSLTEPTRAAGQDPAESVPGQVDDPDATASGAGAGAAAGTPAADRAPRHGRGARPVSDGERPRRLRATIATKIGALLAVLLVVLIGSSAVLIVENRATAQQYDTLLTHEVQQALLARQMQVEFKKQVQEWKDLLLRGSDPADLVQYKEAFEAQDAKTDALYRQLQASDPDTVLHSQLLRFNQFHRTVDAAYGKALDEFIASDGKDFKTADKAVRGIDRPVGDQVDRMVNALETRIAARTFAQQQLTESRQRLTLIVSAAVLVLLAALLTLALIRIVRPLRRLTRQAEQVATDRLPAAISQVKALPTGEQAPVLPAFAVSTHDEVSDLAVALNALQDSALNQAVEQHRADRETADMLVNLGRRNQNLLGRMLSYVTELERKEQDPDVLSQLFRLDHATTRIRRNAESMLVLAGATQTRTWSRPVPVIDVVRAALSEIEEYIRVDLHHIEDGLVNGSAVADVVHLIAELVENATHFSPPTTQVTVVGQRVRDGYRLRVIDQGVGMTRRELDDANERIRRAEGGWSDSKLLGLYVVGRLARRRDIQVALEPSAGRGITATVQLPDALLGASAGTGRGSAQPGLPSAAALLDGAPAANAYAEPTVTATVTGPVAPLAPLPPPAPAAHPLPTMPAALEAAVMPTFSGPPPVAHVESVAHVAPAGPSTGSVGWSAPTTSDDEPWATLVPPAAPEPVARPAVELESFSASSEPGSAPAFGPGSGARSAPGTRSTIPPVGGANRVIDLTDTGRAGRSDATGGAVPVQWFAADAADAAAATDAVAAGAAGAPGLETLELPHGGPNGALNGRSPVPAGVRSGGGSDAGSPVAPGAIPRRVRGAQLPDLGPAAEPVLARPDDGPGAAESLRWQLRSFQLDVQAARRALTDSDPATTSAPVARPAPAASAAPDQASRSDHHEQADRIHGHDPEGE